MTKNNNSNSDSIGDEKTLQDKVLIDGPNEQSGSQTEGPLDPSVSAEERNNICNSTKSELNIEYTFNEKDEWKYPIDHKTKLRLVVFVDGDKANPKNFSPIRKWLYTFLLAFTCFVVAFGSAVVTGDLEGPVKYFRVSREVIILASVSTFVLGFGVGPLVSAPLSEEFGRKPVYAITLFLAVIFIIPCALAKNIGTLIVCRLIDGILFSAPICLIGGSLADLFDNDQRGIAMLAFSGSLFIGPVVGPIFGGLLGDNAPTWRWLYYSFLIISGFAYVLFITIVPETHAATILKRRCYKLRTLTGDNTYYTLSQLKGDSMTDIIHRSMVRPFALLSEIIVALLTIYMSINYGLLYMNFFAYPIIYMEGKGWSASKTGIMFIPIGVGIIIASLVAIYFNKDYNRRAQKYIDNREMPPPELRLIPMMYGCWFIPIGLFIFGWTSYPTVSWAGPCFAGIASGIGFNMVYNPANNYIVDSYSHYAASALAAKTFVRSVWGAGVVLFTEQMYHKLGYQWASSLMAFISLACCAIPFLFYIYGQRIRKFSRYAYSPESN